MALNKLMHPRNPYRDCKPNFKELARKYQEFKDHATEDSRGGFHIDFKKPECLRALTWALLKEDFNLDVLLPLDRLIPTVPLRINYILWLEDILGDKKEDIRGIDIGCGASCVYGLLGAKKNSWTFLCSEADATNMSYASKNVQKNELEQQISVMKVTEDTILYDILSDNDHTYDFSMCNPPFFGSNFEAWGMLTTRSDDRPEPSSVNTASPAESIVPGGEVEFIKRMISDSCLLKDRVRVYTTMLGKKSSLSVLKEELKRNGITNIGVTEFCQGKTMRWGLGWTFDSSISFPKLPSKVIKAEKSKPPLVYTIPHQVEHSLGIQYTLDSIIKRILSELKELQIIFQETKDSPKEKKFQLTAVKNTWSNQRRKRRLRQRLNSEDKTPHKIDTNDISPTEPEQDTTQKETELITCKNDLNNKCLTKQVLELSADFDKDAKTDEVNSCKKRKIASTANETDDGNVPENENHHQKKRKLEDDCNESESKFLESLNSSSVPLQVEDKSTSCETENKVHTTPSDDDDDFLFKSSLTVTVVGIQNITMEMQWTDGQSREYMHQVVQYLKNKFQELVP